MNNSSLIGVGYTQSLRPGKHVIIIVFDLFGISAVCKLGTVCEFFICTEYSMTFAKMFNIQAECCRVCFIPQCISVKNEAEVIFLLEVETLLNVLKMDYIFSISLN